MSRYKLNNPSNETVLRQITENPTVLSTSSTHDVSGKLGSSKKGARNAIHYYVKSDEDVYILQGASTVEATSASWRLAANEEIEICVDDPDANGYVSVLSVSSSITATVQIMPCNSPNLV